MFLAWHRALGLVGSEDMMVVDWAVVLLLYHLAMREIVWVVGVVVVLSSQVVMGPEGIYILGRWCVRPISACCKRGRMLHHSCCSVSGQAQFAFRIEGSILVAVLFLVAALG